MRVRSLLMVVVVLLVAGLAVIPAGAAPRAASSNEILIGTIATVTNQPLPCSRLDRMRRVPTFNRQPTPRMFGKRMTFCSPPEGIRTIKSPEPNPRM